MLAFHARLDYYHIAYVVRMWLALSVFTLIVLNDKPLDRKSVV